MSYIVEGVSGENKTLDQRIDQLLEREGILRDKNLDYTCVILENADNPIATGSCFGNTLRCMAVDHHYQGEGLMNLIVMHLTEYLFSRGKTHLFLYTKVSAAPFFENLGFSEITRVDNKVVFMENRRSGFSDYLKQLKKECQDRKPSEGKKAGAVVMNANPFTMGHQYLVERAAEECSILHLFVVEEDCSSFPFPVRMELVKQGTAHLDGIVYHQTGSYMISQNTFPSYFLKEEAAVCEAHARLDVSVFQKIAEELNIQKRFVGEEPASFVTDLYNKVMKQQLEKNQIQTVVIPRKKSGESVISASSVRASIRKYQLDEVRDWVPDTTWQYLQSEEAVSIIAELQKEKMVEVSDMSEAREKRFLKQQELLHQYGGTLICFTMNIAGPVKNSFLIRKAFLKGYSHILALLKAQSIELLTRAEINEFTGNEAFLVVSGPGDVIKRLMTGIEEEHPIGRLFDIDVIDYRGRKYERRDIGMQPRKCLLCDSPAAVCASRRVHPLEEIVSVTNRMITDYLKREFAEEVSQHAVRALLYEVAVTPKPGLVDRNNQGAHKDMDFYSFIDSAVILRPYFRSMAAIGIESADQEPEYTFLRLQREGMLAEQAMLKVTDQVNTHKGAIFSLGIVCGAVGRLWMKPQGLQAERILKECKNMTSRELSGFFATMEDAGHTAGCQLYRRYGIRGVRGEAMEGFPTVGNIAYPMLKQLLADQYSKDEAGSRVLLKIFTETTDTNAVSRSDYSTFLKLREEIRELLQKDRRPGSCDIEKTDAEFIRKNISPGGSADLLAMCWFLYFIEQMESALL